MVIILAGGTSAEREVSLSTAKTIVESLVRQNSEFIQIDAADTDWLERIQKTKPRVVFIALHGPFGEDGKVQKILEQNGLAYTGSGPETSALTINKIQTKKKVRDNYQIKVAKDFTGNSVSYPAVVKPNKQGSSYGVSIVKDKSELPRAIDSAKKFDEDGEYLLEEYIEGTELTCAVIDLFGKIEALPLVEIVPNNNFFDYQAKYDTESGCQEICPARIKENIAEEIKQKSITLFRELKLNQYCRIDWILRGQTPYFLEINTLPGMTPTSLINKELLAANIKFDDFIRHLLDTAK